MGIICFSQPVIIDELEITGNKQTKAFIIQRELTFAVGDTVEFQHLDSLFERSRELLYNTRLFNDTKFTFRRQSDRLKIFLHVEERWYTWPAPVFGLIDRNFNQWWVNENRDISRIEYGLRLYRFNMRGRNERLRLKVQGGFTETLGFEYRIPFIDRQQKFGLELDVEYLTNRTIIYRNEGHITQNLYSEEILLRRFYSYATLTYRPDLVNYHRINFGYMMKSIADTIALANPDYYLNGNTEQNYPHLSYTYRKDERDLFYYPLRGQSSFFFFEHNGFGLSNFNRTQFFVSHSRYNELIKQKLFYAFSADVSVSFPKEQPYQQFAALGLDENYVRGFELYLINGQHWALWRNSLKWRFIDWNIDLGDFMPIKQFRMVPLQVYLKSFADFGYVHRANLTSDLFLVNQPLGSIGLGIDITSFYDFVVRIEGSYNSKGNFRVAFNVGADIL